MIENPFEMGEICFFDWDDTVIGILHLPNVIRDVRAFVNFFVGSNLVHPELRGGLVDPWAEERARKRAEAKKDWPRNQLYPEESWYLEMGKGGLEVKHSLRFKPGKRLSVSEQRERMQELTLKKDGG